MKFLITLAGAAGFFYTANAAWTTTKIVDEMTDATKYFLSTEGTKIQIDDLSSYTPELCVRIAPIGYDVTTDTMSYKHEQFFTIKIEGLKRSGDAVQLRFDSAPAVSTVYSASTDRRAGFFNGEILKRIFSSTNVLLRFETTLGAVRTTRFNTVGLVDAMRKLKVQIKDTLPPLPETKPTVERPKPTAKAAPEKPNTRCSKCSGKGTVTGWTKCVYCGGSGRGYDGKRCTKCVRSAKTGHVKTSAPCTVCNGSGYLSK